MQKPMHSCSTLNYVDRKRDYAKTITVPWSLRLRKAGRSYRRDARRQRQQNKNETVRRLLAA